MLEHNAYDTVCHEHLDYYSIHQIQWMADRCELRLLDVEINDVNGGSFAVTVCKQGAPYISDQAKIQSLLLAEDEAQLSTLEPYEAFKTRVFAHRTELLETVHGLLSKGKRILGYGASTKGNVILQFCGLTETEIPAIAEVNTDKFGSFTPGTKIPIISEAQGHERQPDYLLVLPWHFRDNLIRRESAFLKKGGKMIFPLPKISIYSE